MTIERWNPVQEIDRMQNWMQRWFDEDFNRFSPSSFRGESLGLPVDVTETERGYELKASVAGYRPEDIQIDVNQEVVTLRGEIKPQEREEQKGNYIYRERRAGSFYRQLRLPNPVDSSKAEATVKDGLLHLYLPKAAQTTSNRVAVKTAR